MIDIPGATLFVHDVGQGPPILFVHGFPLDHTMWREQVADLSRDHRCIVPDLRGFGKSSVTEGKVQMSQFADDLAALLDALAITEPIVFCGLSMGGYVAWQFARRHANKLKSLILCDTRAMPDTPQVVSFRRELAEEVAHNGAEVIANAMLTKLVSDRKTPARTQLKSELRRVIMATDPQGIIAASNGIAERPDVRPWLPSITVPALVLVGEQDVISPPAEVTAFAAMLPRATLCLIPDAGHLAPLENPQPVNAAIRAFLAST